MELRRHAEERRRGAIVRESLLVCVGALPWIRLERRRPGASNRGTSIAIVSRHAYAIEMMACWANRRVLRRSGVAYRRRHSPYRIGFPINMTTCDMSSEQSLGIEKTSVKNFRASSGTRTGTDALEGSFGALKIQSIRWNQNWDRCVRWGDAALKSRRRESHFPFGNVAVIMNQLVSDSR
jgi:hypothetical protein